MENVLNRVMIHEYHFSALLVAFFMSLPYLSSPLQAWVGALSDRRPFFGYHRTPYIGAGVLLCAAGVVLAPWAAIMMTQNFYGGLLLCFAAFGCWGLGFNLATVSYFSLASEVSGPEGKARTIATMFILMIVSVITASLLLGKRLDPFSNEALTAAFLLMGVVALVLGWSALVGLEKKTGLRLSSGSKKNAVKTRPFHELFKNPRLLFFFVYLFFLLVPLLGQDLLIEPFGAQIFGLSVKETTRLSSIWGTGVLICMILAAVVEKSANRRSLMITGSWMVFVSLAGLVVSGLIGGKSLFYFFLFLMGLGTGLSTVSNLSYMLDMTAAGKVGAYMGLWGMSDTLARGSGNLFNGALLDMGNHVFRDPKFSYTVVWGLAAIMILISLILLRFVGRLSGSKKSP